MGFAQAVFHFQTSERGATCDETRTCGFAAQGTLAAHLPSSEAGAVPALQIKDRVEPKVPDDTSAFRGVKSVEGDLQ
jgi:hypothetical protein